MRVEAIAEGGLLPWHRSRWDRLQRARRAGRLPHALLLTGPAGVGKRLLLRHLVESLLCRSPDEDGKPCGRCTDCTLLAADTHPDLIVVAPDEQGKSREIKVAAVRELAGSDALTAHRGGWRTLLIDPADRMNRSAANALLKTLEEPARGTLICLVSEHPSRLPATIRSRCQTLDLPLPAEDDALAWLSPRVSVGEPLTLLRLARGAPLRALDLADEERLSLREGLFAGFIEVSRGRLDPVAEAAAWNKLEPEILLDWLSGWVGDLLRLGVSPTRNGLCNPDKAAELANLAENLDPAGGHRFLQRVWAVGAEDLSNLNRLLLCESLLIEWTGVMQRSTRS
jgi:DNA polymerase-3 subunit delta'